MRFHLLILLLIALTAFSCARREAYRAIHLGHEYEENGYPARALQSYEDALSASPHDAFVLHTVGNAYLRRADFDRATELYLLALELEPAYLEAFEGLILVARAQDENEAALGWLERAAEVIPDYGPLSEQLVDVYVAQDRLDDALVLLERLVASRDDEAWVHFRLGHLRIQLRDYDGAIASFERTTQLDPDNPKGWASLGTAYHEGDNQDEAIDAYLKVLEIDPHDDSSLNNLAWVYATQGQNLEEAIRLSRQSLRIRPKTPQYLDTLADLYYQRGDRDRALELIRYAIGLRPESLDLKAHLERQLTRFERGPLGRV
jgi:tetratricopeptide (TPR) repeat protein